MSKIKDCLLCGNTFDAAPELKIELRKDGYGECNYCPKCGRPFDRHAEPENKPLTSNEEIRNV